MYTRAIDADEERAETSGGKGEPPPEAVSLSLTPGVLYLHDPLSLDSFLG